jgi:hypothetical protein
MIRGQDFLHPAHDSTDQAHFDPVRMKGGMGEDIFYDSFCQVAGALILLLHYPDTGSRSDLSSISSIHLHDHWAAISPSSLIWMPTSLTQHQLIFKLRLSEEPRASARGILAFSRERLLCVGIGLGVMVESGKT